MGWITHLAVYFVIWWVTLFAVLPFGVRQDDDVVLGNDPGAPQKSRIVLKLAINTLVALVLWFIVFLIDYFDLVTIDQLRQR